MAFFSPILFEKHSTKCKNTSQLLGSPTTAYADNMEKNDEEYNVD